jgi:T-complex protein 1 subunit beta
MSKVQDDEVGDGTTSVVVFASELLREAEKLIDMRIHPQTIVAGWRKATQVARKVLEANALDHGGDPEKFREDLMNIARTTLSSKILSAHKDFFSKMAVDAVLRLKKSSNLDAIQIIKVQGGTLEESFLDEGEQACVRKDVSKLFCHLFINITMGIFLYYLNYFVIINIILCLSTLCG